ncbi:MAG TPA: VIT1/CCC1 transporter family protein [Polyangiales bacterium]|nr:VIT1/CCC1 transporter family protein [Polyangiales bacterium]
MSGRPEAGVGHYLRDIVNGACDGVVTTLAIVAGVSGAQFEPRVAVVLGIVNLAADGLSMGASNYLGMKSELEQLGHSVAFEAPWRHGVATTLAFVAAGTVPLVTYALPLPDEWHFATALALAGVALGVVGASRSAFTGRPAWRCALEMLLIGGAAAGVGYVLGLLVDPLLPGGHG